MDPMDVPPLPTPDSALGVAHSPPPAETPRRPHLRQLSLASGPLLPRTTSSPPSGASTPTGTPRSSPPPSSLTRPGSAGRRATRQSSISYSPSLRTVPDATANGSENGPPAVTGGARIPLGGGSGRVFSRAPAAIQEDDDETASSVGRARSSRSSLSIGSASSFTDRESPATPKEPLTVVDQYASLLSSIARKEAVILDLRNTLGGHEKELADLKAQWRQLAATASAPGAAPGISASTSQPLDSAASAHSDNDSARIADQEGEDTVKSLLSDLANVAGGGIGWGKKFGDLATGLNANEHFIQSKRASLSLASTLTSSWSAFNSMSPLTLPLSHTTPAPASPTPQPRSSPVASPLSTAAAPRKISATKMRPIGATAPRQLTSPCNTSFPGVGGTGTGTGADFFSGLDESPTKLQAPLAPSGGMPTARLPSPGPSPGRRNAPAAASDAGETDDWNW